jgi:hypothetical protein
MEPIEEMIDAGARAILAGMSGDKEEYRRQVERGRSALVEAKHATERKIIEAFDKSIEDDARRRRKPRPSKPLTQNMGDLLRAAGIKAEGD